MTTKLTDRQLVILSAAGARNDRTVLPLSASLALNAGAAALVIKSLIKKGLIEERPTEAGQEIWRRTEDGEALTLVITSSGLDAVGIDPGEGTSTVVNGEGESKGVAPAKPTSEPAGATKATNGRSVKPAANSSGREKTMPVGRKASSINAKARGGTKIDATVKLLQRKKGATIADLMQATGWQAHSVRGAISGTLKKKLGLTVISQIEGSRGRVYRITDGEAQA